MLDKYPGALPDDVAEELSDPRFANRKHYSRSTYAKKCRGPLCRKAERDRGRDRWREGQEAEGKTVTPRPALRAEEDDSRLDPIIEWYLNQRKEAVSA